MGMKDRFRADRDFIDGVLNDADDMVVVARKQIRDTPKPLAELAKMDILHSHLID